jgi:toxin-antitoxin system PIN domain toxin
VIVPDVNLLLYAVVSAFPQHGAAHAWWEETVNSSAEIGLTSPAIFGFIRIATNPRVLSPPLTINAATGYVSAWLGQPNVSHLIPGPRHVEIAFGLLHSVGTGGNLTTDVQLAHSRPNTTRTCFRTTPISPAFPAFAGTTRWPDRRTSRRDDWVRSQRRIPR